MVETADRGKGVTDLSVLSGVPTGTSASWLACPNGMEGFLCETTTSLKPASAAISVPNFEVVRRTCSHIHCQAAIFRALVVPGWRDPPLDKPIAWLPSSAIWAREIEEDNPFIKAGNEWAKRQTLLSFTLPRRFESVGREVAITLVACGAVEANAQTHGAVVGPDFAVTLNAPTSARWFCIGLAAVVVLSCYLAAVLALSVRLKAQGRVRDGSWRSAFNPIVLTAGWDGRGSPAKLQMLFFTLIVAGLLTYILSRAGLLSDLSLSVLALLGISSIGALVSRATDVARNRLDYDNWAWLIRKGWLTTNGLAGKHSPCWADLLAIRGEFDIPRFQVVAFSMVVGAALLHIGLTDLSSFIVPPALLGLLGLSQATYVAGKIAGPNDIDELDKAIHALRGCEEAFVLKAGISDDPDPQLPGVRVPPPMNLQSAARRAQAEYNAYLLKEIDVRTMFDASLDIKLGVTGPRFL